MTGGPHSPLPSIAALRPRQREGQFAERSQSPSFPPEAVDRNGSRRACGLIIARFAAEGALFSWPSECGNVLCLKWKQAQCGVASLNARSTSWAPAASAVSTPLLAKPLAVVGRNWADAETLDPGKADFSLDLAAGDPCCLRPALDPGARAQ